MQIKNILDLKFKLLTSYNLIAQIILIGLFLFSNPSKATDQAAINLEQISKLSEKSDKLHRDIGKLLFAIAEEAQLEIIRKGNQFEEDLEDWRTGDSINGEDFNQKFEEALIIGQAYGLDALQMRKLFTLLKKQILRADLVSSEGILDEAKPSVLESITKYFDWLGKQEAELEADQAEIIAIKQEQRTRLFKSTCLIFFDALIEQDAVEAQAKFNKLRQALQNIQSADAELLQVEAEKIFQTQKLIADTVVGIPILGEIIDIYSLSSSQTIAGEKLSGTEQAVTLIFLIPVFGDLIQIAKRSPAAANALGVLAASINAASKENLQLMSDIYNRSKDELLELSSSLKTIPEVRTVSNKLSSELYATQSDSFLLKFGKSSEGVSVEDFWNKANIKAENDIMSLQDEFQKTDKSQLLKLNEIENKKFSLTQKLEKKLEEFKNKQNNINEDVMLDKDVILIKNQLNENSDSFIKVQKKYLKDNKNILQPYIDFRKNNLSVKKLRDSNNEVLLRQTSDLERVLFGKAQKVKNKITGEDVIVNTNDGVVDRMAFSSIQKEFKPAIDRLNQNKKLINENSRLQNNLKKAREGLQKAKLTKDSVSIAKAQEILETTEIVTNKLKKQIKDIPAADEAVMQIEAEILRLHRKAGGKGPKSIKELDNLEIEVLSVTNKLPDGPSIGTDRDVTYQLLVKDQKVDIPHEFVEVHYSKALFETLNPDDGIIDLLKPSDVQKAKSFGYDMDHAVTSSNHAEAYKLYSGKLDDALGGNPATLSMQDASSLEMTFKHKGYHWLEFAEKAAKEGNQSLSLMRKGEAMRQISKQYRNMLLPRIKKAGLNPEDILAPKAIEFYRLFQKVETEILNPAEVEAAVNYFGISLQESFDIIASGLSRVTQYSQSKLAYNIVNRVNEGKTAQKDAEKIMESIGLSWSETKSLSNNFLLYEQKYKALSQ